MAQGGIAQETAAKRAEVRVTGTSGLGGFGLHVRGGARDCPYTYVQDLVAGSYRLPWKDEVTHKDGQSCGFAAPTRDYVGPEDVTTPSRVA